MAKKTTLTVTTDVGTFTRTTARTYTHLVVVKGYRAERLEAFRLAEIQQQQKTRAEYERVLATNDPTIGARDGRDPVGRAWDIECHTKFIADGSYAKWIAEATERITELKARGPITEDGNNWSDFNPRYAHSSAQWLVLGWCGRYDLALKLARGKDADAFRDVRIYTVVDGARVD